MRTFFRINHALIIGAMPGAITGAITLTQLGMHDCYAISPRDSIQKLEQIYNNKQLPNDQRARTVEEWIDEAKGVTKDFNAFQLSRTLYLLSKIKNEKVSFEISQGFIAIWEQNAVHVMNSFTSQGLCNSIYAFAQLGITPSQEWMNKFQSTSSHKLEKFNSQDLSNSIYAFAGLGITPSQEWMNKFQSISSHKLEKFNSQDLSNSIYAFAELGITPSQEWMNKFQSTSFYKLEEFNSQVSSNSIYALARLGIAPSQEWMNKFQSTSSHKLENFKPQELSNSVYAFARLGIAPSQEWMKKFQVASSHKLENFKPQELSNSIYAFAKLGITPSQEWMKKFQVASSHKLENFKSQELSNSIYAFSLLGIQFQSQFDFDTLLDPFMSRIESMKKMDSIKLDLIESHQLYLAAQYLKLFRQKTYPLTGTDSLLNSFKNQQVRTSNSENQFGIYLKNKLKGKALSSSYWFEPLATYFDFAIPDQKVAIQFDGPTHFIQSGSGKKILRPQDQFQNRMLEKLGWKIIRISYEDWGKKNYQTIDKLLDDGLAQCEPTPSLSQTNKNVSQCQPAISNTQIEDALKPQSTSLSQPASKLNPYAKEWKPKK